MAPADVNEVSVVSSRLNVADRLATFASRMPDAIAVAAAGRRSTSYSTITFGELDADATRIAQGLVDWGITPGTRLVLLVRPGIEFVTLVFALLRAGAVIVLVDPGMGRKNLVKCLAEVEPNGFVAIPVGHVARLLYRKQFSNARWNVTVGRRWFWGGMTLGKLRRLGSGTRSVPATFAHDPAAIIFTSGSTGPPKGVLYTHRMFDTQVAEIQSQYAIAPGGVDLSCFPLFALFNSAMGVTTVLPHMDFSRPADARPYKLLRAANDWKVTQAFASPALWRNLGIYCRENGGGIPTLREVFSCGAPVAPEVLRATLELAAPDARMHTPYGATECLPVATIEAAEVLGETALKMDEGDGVCVGRKFDSIDWRVIRIADDPIATMDDAESLPVGEIGELVVRGPQASPFYVTRVECNADAKISSDSKRAGRSSAPHGGEDAPARSDNSHAGPWHRMGDVGYFDSAGRFWYCGRKSHRVETERGPLYTECVEAIFNAHHWVGRTALVGLGRAGRQTPVLIVEPSSESFPPSLPHDLVRFAEGASRQTVMIRHILILGKLPVDVRHNAKINRELLAEWAATKLPELA